MSSDPEAVVRRVIDLYNQLPEDPERRAASPELRELLSLCSDDIQFVGLRSVDFRDAHDKHGFERTWAQWLDMWKSHRNEIEELHVAGDQVLVFSRDRFVARDNVAFQVGLCAIYAVESGRVARIEVFGEDRDAAWAAFNEGAADAG